MFSWQSSFLLALHDLNAGFETPVPDGDFAALTISGGVELIVAMTCTWETKAGQCGSVASISTRAIGPRCRLNQEWPRDRSAVASARCARALAKYPTICRP